MRQNEQWVDLATDKEEEKRLQQIQEERRLAAERHKDTLLEFDRQGSRRTKIIGMVLFGEIEFYTIILSAGFIFCLSQMRDQTLCSLAMGLINGLR